MIVPPGTGQLENIHMNKCKTQNKPRYVTNLLSKENTLSYGQNCYLSVQRRIKYSGFHGKRSTRNNIIIVFTSPKLFLFKRAERNITFIHLEHQCASYRTISITELYQEKRLWRPLEKCYRGIHCLPCPE